MKTTELKPNYHIFGNKGNVWSNTAHIAENSNHTTMCGVPMLSNNWAKITKMEDIGCPKCLEEYNKTN